MTASPRPRPDPVPPGGESVWSYPRPPSLEPAGRRLRIVLGGETIARSDRGYRVLETSHPPNYYLPVGDVAPGALARTQRSSFCEWKGRAHYYTVSAGDRVAPDAAWGYDHPTAPFEILVDHVAFYPGAMDACYVDEQLVVPQPGGFYGGCITDEVAGPFKGGPGTAGW